ncbi:MULTISPECIES: PLP-dependent aminotransferase family protein [Marivita]|uniref:PLP-dependent aminotransferase family protein n=1 Tax=Marivita cryptomonadis TaxID=505252 RepID=A0A9Q2RZL2_9RHOB|nr:MULTISPECIES: PLP-dependent aminotransferase family protein [Marivita]MCR9168952.1 PLP-dependent aminotransferase family protein [Paracoccaceae bacterium]MBM2321617.1 PLP-dependent aminotransferase family protein [Marivita cryptomonadis]MBM2331198.1 PLP-dependent aminotransferase family protein [Marivita cryptomonadis]MBM2340784.1 PLP-dependent aminotransferase family protein [Marivita cryptomonadis]MBM2345446.1 PLP-dependent aminotransferase family protein [Marivita cryptomonadis]
MAIPVENFFLKPDTKGTLQARIQQTVAEGILSGRFRRGEKLPSSRKLAHHLGVSRITVTLAYTELLANDYLTSRGRSGYYVSDDAPEPPQFENTPKREDTVDWSRALGQKFTGAVALVKPQDWAQYRYPFLYGQTDPQLFDHANWRLCALQALGAKDFAALTRDYYDQDDPQLVEFILRHTLPRRGIAAKPDEVLITMGAQNALWMTSQVLLNQRRHAVIENPCYPALRGVLTHSRCHLSALDVDEDGLPPDQIPENTDVIFTTPSHQCPTSYTMPLARRQALLNRARALDALIVEDDYEFEMAYLKSPMPALKSLDEDGRVIYVGSFSKSLFPGLRLGYLVGSAPFIREVRALRAAILRHPPGLTQRTTAYFLSLGHYDSLIRRTGKALNDRRVIMEHAIGKYGLTIAGKGTYGGSSFWMQAPEHVDCEDLAKRLSKVGVLIEPGTAFFAGESPPRNYYRLAYSSIAQARIDPGVAEIAKAIEATPVT